MRRLDSDRWMPGIRTHSDTLRRKPLSANGVASWRESRHALTLRKPLRAADAAGGPSLRLCEGRSQRTPHRRHKCRSKTSPIEWYRPKPPPPPASRHQTAPTDRQAPLLSTSDPHTETATMHLAHISRRENDTRVR